VHRVHKKSEKNWQHCSHDNRYNLNKEGVQDPLEDLLQLNARANRHQLEGEATNTDGCQRHNNVQDNAFGFGVEDQEPAHNIKIDGVSFGVFLKKKEED